MTGFPSVPGGGRRFAALVVAVLAASPGAATPTVVVRLHPAPDVRAEVGHAKLVGRELPEALTADGTARLATLERPLAGLSEVILHLPESTRWRIGVEGAGLWAAPVEVQVAASSVSVDIDIWPAAELVGALVADDGVPAPRETRLRVCSPRYRPDGARKGALPPTDVVCSRDGERFTCPIPATALDARLLAGDFVPLYLWDVSVPRDTARDIGVHHLRRGASLAGWVLRQRGGAGAGAVVTLTPAMPRAYDPATRSRLTALAATGRCDERGFFQIVGVPPGAYGVRAELDGFSPAEQDGLRVEAGSELRLGEPLLLAPLADAVVLLEPPVDLAGRPWRVALRRASPATALTSVVAKGETSAGGEWQRRGIAAGRYELAVADHAGSTWWRREVELSADSPPLVVEIPHVELSGTITLGERAAPATLRFETESGLRIMIDANSEGRFRGALPKAGPWRVEVQLEEVPKALVRRHVDVPEDGRSIAIELPGGVVRGRVVDESGAGVAGAEVRAVRAGPSGGTQATAEGADDGGFALLLDPGPVTLQATADNRDSGLVPHRVTERDDEPVTLVLHRKAILQGRVLDEAGGVPGAVVRASDPAFVYGREEVTDPNGAFRLEMPPGVAVLDVVVLAAGRPVKVDRVALTDRERTTVDLVLPPVGGRLEVAVTGQPPYLGRGSSVYPWWYLTIRSPYGPPRGLDPARGVFTLDLEPGRYTLCPDATIGPGCRAVDVPAGGIVRIDPRSLREQGEPAPTIDDASAA